MEGVIVRIAKNDQVLREFKYPSNLKKAWDSDE